PQENDMRISSLTRAIVSAAIATVAALAAARPAGAQPPPPPDVVVPELPAPPVALVTTVPPIPPIPPMVRLTVAPYAASEERAAVLNDQAREAIEEGRYERAVERFSRLIDLKSNRTDAALYWKAYAQNKLGQKTEALTTLADLEKTFADSRWIRDAKALE